MTWRTLVLATALAVSAPAAGAGQGTVPGSALAAEAAGRWADAASAYREVLVQDPNRADLWLRLADVETQRGDVLACALALEQVARIVPGDAAVQRRLSQTYAVSNQPRDALRAIESALSLQPDNVDDLRARAVLAAWSGDHERARQTYRRLLELRPDDIEPWLELARLAASTGNTNQAVDAYRRYLAAKPQASEAWIELARAESWRGNYAGSLEALEKYRTLAGQTPAYVRELAAILAGSGKPTRAISLIEPLLSQEPDAYDLHHTRAIALAMQARPREAYAALQSVRELDHASVQTHNAERIVRAALGSTLGVGASAYSDSDNLEIQRIAPGATLALPTGTRLSAGYERDLLYASRRDLQQVDGSARARLEHAWGGIVQKIGVLTLDVRAGRQRAEARELTSYLASAQIRPADSFKLTLERSLGFFGVSPRTVGLGLTTLRHAVDLQLTPGLRFQLALAGSLQQLSDGNRRSEATITPRVAVVRRERVNLDLGFSAYQLRTTRDLAHGYYDPARYDSYGVVVAPYFKLTENTGFGLYVLAGVQRDDSSPTFQAGGQATAEMTLGIYRAWVLKIAGSATQNQRLESGGFRGFSGSATLTRRF